MVAWRASISRCWLASKRARNNSSLFLKFEYTAPLVKPAAAATSSSEAPWKPRSAKTRAAASSR